MAFLLAFEFKELSLSKTKDIVFLAVHCPPRDDSRNMVESEGLV